MCNHYGLLPVADSYFGITTVVEATPVTNNRWEQDIRPGQVLGWLGNFQQGNGQLTVHSYLPTTLICHAYRARSLTRWYQVVNLSKP